MAKTKAFAENAPLARGKGKKGGLLPDDSAVFNLKANLRLWIITLAALAADLLTKHWAVKNLVGVDGEDRPINIIHNYLRFCLTFNEGAVAGMAQGKTGLLIISSVIAIMFLLWIFATSKAKQWWGHLGIALILAGALGNLYDRLFNSGQVVDFIEVNLHFWPANPWPIFNVADILLCAGVGVLLIHFTKLTKAKPRS